MNKDELHKYIKNDVGEIVYQRLVDYHKDAENAKKYYDLVHRAYVEFRMKFKSWEPGEIFMPLHFYMFCEDHEHSITFRNGTPLSFTRGFNNSFSWRGIKVSWGYENAIIVCHKDAAALPYNELFIRKLITLDDSNH